MSKDKSKTPSAEVNKLTAELEAVKQERDGLETEVNQLKDALAAAENQGKKATVEKGTVTIASRSNGGFRRFGKRFTPDAETFKIDDFTQEEMEALEAEKNLVVVKG